MIFRDIVAPTYAAPTVDSPAWVWSIAGHGWNAANSINSVIVRFDYVKLTADGKIELVPNFYSGGKGDWYYRPAFTQQNYGSNSAPRWIDGTTDANNYWTRWAYKMLFTMKTCCATAYTMKLPLPTGTYKGDVVSYSNLPGSGNTARDLYKTLDTGDYWMWMNSSWNNIGWYP